MNAVMTRVLRGSGVQSPEAVGVLSHMKMYMEYHYMYML